jgi:sulfite reductase (NADPH) flavoprotein alpha-component
MSLPARPLLPETAPFASEQIGLLNRVMAETSLEQRSWLSGFLAGYAAATVPAGPQPAAVPAPRPLAILFLTESGNAEGVAADARKAAARGGFKGRLIDAAEIAPSDLAGLESLLVVASTWGEGDPPERALRFYEALMADDTPRFEGVSFAVLALGDSSYVDFCAVGRRIDARLEELGATRIAERVDCDLDFEGPASAWTSGALDRLAELTEDERGASAGDGEIIHVDFAGSTTLSRYSKSQPFAAEIIERVELSSSRSTKETLHLELSLDGSGLSWQPGDSLGIVVRNDPEMALAVARAVGLAHDGALVERLERDLDITALSRRVIEAYAAVAPTPELHALLEDDAWRGYLEGRQIIDLLEDFPAELSAEQLTGLLRSLPPRLYSIASSHAATPDEAHLLVGVVRYQSVGRDRRGVASTFVADRLRADDRLEVYVKPNERFRLPDDPDRPMIMIGPGTGVAPFRAFLQERQARGAKGRNWLFFGDRSFTHDFTYQLDWQAFRKEGVLDRMDVAFSRDQPEKIYVQHRLWDQRRELFAWLEEGAHLYVCGDEKAMAKDVDATLSRIVAKEGARSVDDAQAYLDRLKAERRYQRDVY